MRDTKSANDIGFKRQLTEAGARARKNNDWYLDAVRDEIAELEGRVMRLREHLAGGGMRLSPEGDPEALLLATQPYPGAHFATFPERLVAPCIKAGTSERGACPACGAPWVREVAVKHLLIQATNNRGKQDEVTGWNRDKWPRMARIGDTTGWRPSCECEAGDPVPCVVLDPFAGSGTTGVVAHKLGRAFVGIDIAGGDADLGGHTAHERLAAALAGRTLAEYQQARAVGQGDLFGASNP